MSGVGSYNECMEVNFFATLRQITGQKTVKFDLPEGSTVWELVMMVVERFPDMHRELINEEGELWPHVHVFVNGRDSRYLGNGVDSTLESTDKVNIFPPVAGG